MSGSTRKNPFTYNGMTESLSYIIGVYLGCGYIETSHVNETTTYILSLSDKSRDFVEYFRNRCMSVLNSYMKPVKMGYWVNKKDEKKITSHFSVCSRDFCSFILKITNNKTTIPSPEYISRDTSEITRSFIQGFLDARGFVIRSNNKTRSSYNWGFSSTGVYLSDIAELIKLQGVELHKPCHSWSTGSTPKPWIIYSSLPREFFKAKFKFNVPYKQKKIEEYLTAQAIPLSGQFQLPGKKVDHKVIDTVEQNVETGENISYVICKICGIKRGQLSRHLTCDHKITVKQYRNKFPGAPNICKEASDKISKYKTLNNPMANSESYDKMVQAKRDHASEFSQTVKDQFASGERKVSQSKGRGRGGIRQDLGHYVRSSWEANFARILRLKNIAYEYENYRFPLKENDQVTQTYIPDFFIPSVNLHVEVKGDVTSRTKKIFSLMKEQRPEINLITLGKKEYAQLSSKYSQVVSWEETGGSDNADQETEAYQKLSSLLNL